MPRWFSGFLAALLLVLLGSVVPATDAAAQVQRNFPENALRGEITIGTPPAVTLNGREALLAPGARIRGENNLLVMSAAVVGQKYTVNYTVDPLGLVFDVWLLRSEEIQRFWPKTREEAAKYVFDPAAQTWTKR